MTPLAQKAHVLESSTDREYDIDTIEPHQSDTDGLWYVKVWLSWRSGGFEHRQQRSEPRCPFAQCACDRPCRPLPGNKQIARVDLPGVLSDRCIMARNWPLLPAAVVRRSFIGSHTDCGPGS